jgi:hypothetical protein
VQLPWQPDKLTRRVDAVSSCMAAYVLMTLWMRLPTALKCSYCLFPSPNTP